MNFTSHKFASVLVVKSKKEQPKNKQVIVDKGIGKTKNLNYMISFKTFMFTPLGRIGGLELRGGCNAYRCACLLRSVVLSAALLSIFHQNNLGSIFLKKLAVFSKTASV